MDTKSIIFLLTGTGIGAAGMYLLMKNKIDKYIQDETESIKAYYEDLYSNRKESENESLEEDADSNELVDKQPETNNKPNVPVEPDYNEIIDKLNYNQFSTKVSNKSNNKAKRPYAIDIDDYNDDQGYVKKVISYFEDDEVLMDDSTQEVLDNVGKDIGYDNLEVINTDGHDEIYVRNDELGIDYMIVSESGSYEDFIGE